MLWAAHICVHFLFPVDKSLHVSSRRPNTFFMPTKTDLSADWKEIISSKICEEYEISGNDRIAWKYYIRGACIHFRGSIV